MARRPRIAALPLVIALWSAWFVLLYGGHAVGCAVIPPVPDSGVWNPLNGALAILTLGMFVVLSSLAVGHWRTARDADTERVRFSGFLNGGAALVAALATLVIGAPLLGYPPCQ